MAYNGKIHANTHTHTRTHTTPHPIFSSELEQVQAELRLAMSETSSGAKTLVSQEGRSDVEGANADAGDGDDRCYACIV
jgi:hypothetical protein